MTRPSKILGIVATAAAALAALPLVVSELRLLSSFWYVADYTIHMAWEAFCVSLILTAFVVFQLSWRVKSLRWAGRALGFVLVVFSAIVGGVVYALASRFWIVWPTYGIAPIGLCLLMSACRAFKPRR